jgi:hypothetical protein
MMRPGLPAQTWCLEIAWESEVNRPNKGFARVYTVFSLFRGKGTQIEEIWLLVYPRGDVKQLAITEADDPLPIVGRSEQPPPPGSRYFAIYVRNVDPVLGCVSLTMRPNLFYLASFRVRG